MSHLDVFAPIPRVVFNGNRVFLHKQFDRRVDVNNTLDTFTASVANTELVAALQADKEFELLGTNAVAGDADPYAEGGILLKTHGAATDSSILLPHLSTRQSPWSAWTWGTDRETQWGCWFKTGAAMTNTTIWCGLKLTNTPTVATDNDQVFFKYVNGTDTTWQCNYSIGGVDTAVDSTVSVAAATEYRMWITISSTRLARFWINGELVATSAALTDATDLIPYIGILSATDATSKNLYVRDTWISRVAA